jgi:GAF domain-containing protein
MLDELSARLLASPDLPSAAEAILDAAIHLHRPDFGHVQVLDKRTNQLVIHAQHGFSRKFLETFKRVSAHDSCASARALRDRAPVIVEDVLSDAKYAAFRDIAAETGYRAVQSMPLIASNGMVVGAASTVFARPHVPSRLEMLMMKLYARLAADTVARFAA